MTTPPDNPEHSQTSTVPWRGRTHSAEQTIALGAALAHQSRAGDLIALIGELGAGKTQLVRGLAVGLGLPPEALASPTFVMAQEYPLSGGGGKSGGGGGGGGGGRTGPQDSRTTRKQDIRAGEKSGGWGKSGGLTLVHIDAYRLKGLDDLQSIGWGDLALAEQRRNALVVVEWADRIAAALGPDRLEIHLTHEDPITRGVTIRGHGSWASRMAGLIGVLERLLPGTRGSPPPPPPPDGDSPFRPRTKPRPGKCPTCGKTVAPPAPNAPFCSERCKLIDLGKWLKGDYRISRPTDQSDLEE